uniref:Uncharacterized protein n=1 Tax=Setaria viridis TaxID=4556 RepID=A0A4U6T7P1_SETVI|nr:hypothetical protein SEVIR_9G479350v2 [Setaria viridis]
MISQHSTCWGCSSPSSLPCCWPAADEVQTSPTQALHRRLPLLLRWGDTFKPPQGREDHLLRCAEVNRR